MRPTSVIAGASRLPLTPKRGNKDFYKGTGQSRVPGGGHRTGPPGVHVVKGKAKYRVLDEKVRIFVGPGAKVLEETELRPYVATQQILDTSKGLTKFFNPYSKSSSNRPKFPSFSPMPSPPQVPSATLEGEMELGKLGRKDFTQFSKRYQNLTGEEKQALIMDFRRNWFNEMSARYGGAGKSNEQVQAEERETKELEARSEGETQQTTA
ncbi:hypothetical protein I302_105500 [Kwoniella bestiolae CBS 10118]|uniref:Uncharacterized protein n=1 Tax=Kwoniella bestiolae CBS 10118 TaxID=1296100 RepID=A0A1B9FTB0_9TREE|nr:hypothetical protein I302_08782 [Kwoniella bestiolae CBS 10118]OCF22001.1 hypothetical protein I302_08782 [Kwoniella bestiolae CBS 10118]